VGGTRSGIRSRQASPEAEPSAGTITSLYGASSLAFKRGVRVRC
jgi:hypothetical protein